MMQIVVGSTNPVKVNAARVVFRRIYAESSVVGQRAASGVREQPFGHEETRAGALNRAQTALAGADYGIGIESGLVDAPPGLMTVNWCVVAHRDGTHDFRQGFGYVLPSSIADLIKKGYTLGQAIDQVTNQTDIRSRQGTSGILTGNLITRQAGYEQLIMLALAPFRRPDFYLKG